MSQSWLSKIILIDHDWTIILIEHDWSWHRSERKVFCKKGALKNLATVLEPFLPFFYGRLPVVASDRGMLFGA